MDFKAQPVIEEHKADHDDCLGYYEDGVKRTLTDEQIAMFRHSEIQALLRDRRLKAENNDIPFEVEEDAGRSVPTLAEEADDLADEDEEEEYARFLREERRQMQRDAATNKRQGTAEDEAADHERKASHRRIARELDVNLETDDSLDYGEEDCRPAHSDLHGREHAQELYERRKVDYADGDTGRRHTKDAASSHVNGARDGGKKIWWPVIGS